MSRRITFVALATTATLIATQAAADRECFEDSCRVQEAAEPQAQAAPEVAAPANKPASNPLPDFVAPETAAAATSADANEARAEAKPAPKPEPKAEAALAAPAPVVVVKPVAPPSSVAAKPEPALVPAVA